MNTNQTMKKILNILAYNHKFSGCKFVIKIGGSVLQDETLVASICSDIQLLTSVGIKIIVIHGGGNAISQHLSKLHIESQFIDGLRVTPKKIMDIIEMVLCGHVNTKLVRMFGAAGLNTIGLTGADSSMLQCAYYSDAHGCVGVVKKTNTDIVSNVLTSDFIPVIAPIGVDVDGNAMNINADCAASVLAEQLQADKLIYLTDQDGIYDENGAIYSELSQVDLLNIIDRKIVQGGMLTKSKAILKALNGHLNDIHILNGKISHVLIEELFTVEGIGTLCKKSVSNINVLKEVL